MAAKKSTAPAGRRSRSPSRKPAELHVGTVLGAKSALMTAIIAMENKGVFGDIATSLRMHVLLPLERIEGAVREQS